MNILELFKNSSYNSFQSELPNINNISNNFNFCYLGYHGVSFKCDIRHNNSSISLKPRIKGLEASNYTYITFSKYERSIFINYNKLKDKYIILTDDLDDLSEFFSCDDINNNKFSMQIYLHNILKDYISNFDINYIIDLIYYTIDIFNKTKQYNIIPIYIISLEDSIHNLEVSFKNYIELFKNNDFIKE